MATQSLLMFHSPRALQVAVREPEAPQGLVHVSATLLGLSTPPVQFLRGSACTPVVLSTCAGCRHRHGSRTGSLREQEATPIVRMACTGRRRLVWH